MQRPVDLLFQIREQQQEQRRQLEQQRKTPPPAVDRFELFKEACRNGYPALFNVCTPNFTFQVPRQEGGYLRLEGQSLSTTPPGLSDSIRMFSYKALQQGFFVAGKPLVQRLLDGYLDL
jgi:hypothetical protein